MANIPEKMMGAILPGNSTIELREFEVPEPGHGQVLVATKATKICGSDIRCIYREHTGKGAEGYIPGMIAGHEPCGIIVKTGPGCKRFTDGDRVIVYHISGCGVCYNCRMGYMIACESDMHCAMTMALLKCATLGKGLPLFGEFTVRHPENKNAELLWHCGPFPVSQKAEGTQARLSRQHFG